MKPTVLLFDIDGTLVSTGGAGRRAMVGAFTELCGRSDVFEGTSFAGMTDRAIVRHGLRQAVQDDSPVAIDRTLDRYVTLLERELGGAQGYRVLPGVVAVLDAIRGRERVAIGLGTGNVKRGATLKLTPGNLHDRFAFGGFGCDAEDRVELLRHGALRGADALGEHLASCRVVVIGDTPKDVGAALSLGAICIGVGTGGFSPDALVRLGARSAFATLEDVAGVHAALFED